MAPSRKANAKRTLVFSNDGHKDATNEVDDKDASKLISPNPSIFESPKKRTKTSVAVITPPKDEVEVSSSKQKKNISKYVPEYIHKNLKYQTEGNAVLPSNRMKAFHLIEDNFVIPDDFEQSRRYGPLSGSCFEERVIKAYNLGTLEPKVETEPGLQICVYCARPGHMKVDCDDLI